MEDNRPQERGFEREKVHSFSGKSKIQGREKRILACL